MFADLRYGDHPIVALYRLKRHKKGRANRRYTFGILFHGASPVERFARIPAFVLLVMAADPVLRFMTARILQGIDGLFDGGIRQVRVDRQGKNTGKRALRGCH